MAAAISIPCPLSHWVGQSNTVASFRLDGALRRLLSGLRGSPRRDQKPEEESETRIPAGLNEGQKQKLVRLLPSNISPSPRRATLKPHWCARSKNMHRELLRMHQSSPPYRRAATWCGITNDSPYGDGNPGQRYDHRKLSQYRGPGFTAHMEEDLDRIASGEHPG